MTEAIEISLNYKKNAAEITTSYIVSEETFRRALSWQAQTAHPTAIELANWLQTNGGKLHRTDGPAIAERSPDGSTYEEYRTNGKRHRADGPAVVWRGANNSIHQGSYIEMYYSDNKLHRTDGPAIVWHGVNGASREEYYVNNKRHRTNGPAIIERFADGMRVEQYYTYDTFVKEERFPSLLTIEGVKIRRSPPAPPTP